jgi:uncharacterized protein YgbK (DUF1537 family)
MAAALLAWYGDDFTGATDTLAVLTQAGLRAMLFMGVPDAAQRKAAEHALGGPLQAVGIAGASRSMAPEAIASELAPVGRFFATLGAPVLHYKVCSTFDSAPGTGSIGAAVAALRPHAPNPFVPIVGGQPGLGRYCAFSNLFAAAGSGGAVERIDRHPTMKNHPVTPMQEADLRRHLALQGLEPVAALHYPAYAETPRIQRAMLQALLDGKPAAVLMDVADAAHLAPAGRLIWERALQSPLLAVGPSGVAQALVAHWQAAGQLPGATPDRADAQLAPASGPVFVFAGSLSPVTARQVRAARSFQHVAVDADALLAGGHAQALEQVHAALRQGRHVIASTAPSGSAAADTSHSARLAQATSRFVQQVLQSRSGSGTPLRRVGIAGGDTSSLAVKALGAWGLSYRGALGAGVTVSRVHSADPAQDGMELMLKGGQMGQEDVFERLLGMSSRA